MQKFEYQVLVRGWDPRGFWGWVEDGKCNNNNQQGSEEALNSLGKEGWELVTVISVPLSVVGTRFTTGLQYLLKRAAG